MTAGDGNRWVMDTSTFTHFCRAKREDVLQRLAPQGLILIPDSVDSEIWRGIEHGYDLPDIDSLPWVERGILTEDEEMLQLLIRVEMPSKPGDAETKNLGECAVLACATERGMIAVIDDRDAREQANGRGVRFVTTMHIIIEAHKQLDDFDTEATEKLYEALLATEMRLPRVDNGIIGWGYSMELLPG
ncbi:hypothetical protein ACN9MI_08625 [Rhodococcoides fascians]|uniref:hypothetical protein n=1 Tax=Rhodococcoides fascians TaxID=1828 RepID=UPI00050BE7F8|nr:hypothetical protein [Rhodococcus fascians]WQH30156.1 hypothetical protein U2G91_09585 [Rhodococcus fascians]